MSTLQELEVLLRESQTTAYLNQQLAPHHWRWVPESLTLRYSHDGISYPVPLTDMTTCASLLDWIMQLSEKAWLSREDLGAFVWAVNELIRPQACLCSGGNDLGEIDVRRHLATGYLG